MYTTSLKTWALSVADDIEEEFAKHRAHIRQMNNVVGGDLAGGNIIKTSK